MNDKAAGDCVGVAVGVGLAVAAFVGTCVGVPVGVGLAVAAGAVTPLVGVGIGVGEFPEQPKNRPPVNAMASAFRPARVLLAVMTSPRRNDCKLAETPTQALRAIGS